MIMDVAPYVYLSVLCSTATYKYRYDISHFVLSKLSLQNKFSTLYYLSWGCLTLCSNEPHFGHRVNYHVSKPIAELILKYSEFLFIRNTIQETAGTHLAKKVSFYKKHNLDFVSSCFLYGGQVLSEGKKAG